jgi:hypothetical protein
MLQKTKENTMPVTNDNMSIDAKVRQVKGTAITKANATTQQLICYSRRIRLKKLRLVVTTTLATTAVSVEVGNAVTIATAPSIATALAVDTDRYFANTDAFSGVLDAAAGTVIELNIGDDIVPANTPVTFTNNASTGAGVYEVYLDFEIVDDNPLTV